MYSSSNNDNNSVNDSIQNISDLILYNNDGDCITKELQETNINDKIVQFDNVSVNIQDSTDVIIGPVTQFNGPVTIYQNGRVAIENDSKLTKTDSTDNTQQTLEKPWIVFNKRYIKYGIIPLFLIILIITITTIVMLVKDDNDSEATTMIPDDHGNSSLGTHKILTRDQWGGHPQRPGLLPLLHPTKLVIISHTASIFCNTIQQCSMQVKIAQELHMSNGSPDIGYNFLIGGDGNVYVGRGWDYQNFHGIESIGISFIGNYIFDELKDSMIECAQMLLDIGLERRKLDKNYKIVAHNQTFATLSPGVNVYKIIKNWPHYSDEIVPISG